jgi:hypothetical protein
VPTHPAATAAAPLEQQQLLPACTVWQPGTTIAL